MIGQYAIVAQNTEGQRVIGRYPTAEIADKAVDALNNAAKDAYTHWVQHNGGDYGPMPKPFISAYASSETYLVVMLADDAPMRFPPESKPRRGLFGRGTP